MNDAELIKKITEKKEFSGLPLKDVKTVFEKFNKDKYLDEEKVKLTRNELRNIFSSFTSQKILSLKNKDEEWILRKHLSTRERLPYYDEVYGRIFQNKKDFKTVLDLGSGINAFSYKYLEKFIQNTSYIGIEAMKQLVDASNNYFKKENLDSRCGVFHLSLLEIDKLKKLVEDSKKPAAVFMFKIIDSLELLKRNYSKELIEKISNTLTNNDLMVLSFATRSMVSKKPFKVSRNWIVNYLRENFRILEDFEIGTERYICFSNNG